MNRMIRIAAAVMLTAGSAQAEEIYKIDTAGKHAFLSFQISHLGFSRIHGHFANFDGVFTFDSENPSASRVEVSIDVASIDTAHDRRDEHLRGEDFFDVANHPRATFASTAATLDENGSGTITGELTLRGITKPVTLTVTGNGAGADPWGNYRRGFDATAQVPLADFGIDYDLGPSATHADLHISLEGLRQGQ